MKTVFITGASGGVGTVVTGHFLQAGWKVYAVTHSEQAQQELVLYTWWAALSAAHPSRKLPNPTLFGCGN